MNIPFDSARGSGTDGFLFGRGAAWFAYGMTIALMIFDYVDRQVIVSMFPFLKAEWNLSDKELGLLVSVISITVAVFGIPVAWIADRVSRVKSIVAMAVLWSIACISCMFAQSYGQLLVARAVVGLGEAGYGSVGAAMVATHFPQRMRGGLLGGFFASASVGSVLGVVLGGVIAARFGWQAAFGVVGIPGLFFALMYLFVRDYQTVEAGAVTAGIVPSPTRGEMVRSILGSPTVRWVCVGAAAQLIALSALWSWLPSFLNRFYGIAPDKAGIQAAFVVLAGALGSLVLGIVVDRAGVRRPGGKFIAVAILSLLSMVTLMLAFRRRAHRPCPDASQPVSPDPARRLPCNLHGWPGRGHRDRRHSPRRPIDRRVDTVARAEPVRSRGWTVHRGVVVRCDRAGERARADTACLHHRGGGVRGGAERLPGR